MEKCFKKDFKAKKINKYPAKKPEYLTYKPSMLGHCKDGKVFFYISFRR
jgi:hypothetical protein